MQIKLPINPKTIQFLKNQKIIIYRRAWITLLFIIATYPPTYLYISFSQVEQV